jgi:AAA domain, putative AbiEii toxin, Type IV TA system
MTYSALAAADAVIIPVATRGFSEEGLTQTIDGITAARKTYNPGVALAGILFTNVEQGTIVASQVLKSVREDHEGAIFPHAIPKASVLDKGNAAGIPGVLLEPKHKAAEAYRNVARRLINAGNKDIKELLEARKARRAIPQTDPAEVVTAPPEAEVPCEGVPNMLGLIVDLCMAGGNLFLIEELENDIHPEGLKALLEVIIAKSSHSQFIVSTHSNVVTKYLGAAPDSRIFAVESTLSDEGVPTSTIRAVEPTPQARITVLRQLGYELYDFDLWDGWLILEESSAERIIRDFLIPTFVPYLTRVRTVAAGGTGNVAPTFEDFRRLFLFAHLEEAYHERAWVAVDGDESGTTIVRQLQEKYPTWSADHFRVWNQPDFERYYPDRFEAKVGEALSKHGRQKREAKKALLDEVIQWCDKEPDAAKAAFANSAAEVISFLQGVEANLSARG